MTDRELIKKILNKSITLVGFCNAEEKLMINNILCKLSGVPDRLNENSKINNYAYFIDEDNYISMCSRKEYPLEWSKREENSEKVLLFPEDIHLLNYIYESNDDNIHSLNKIININIKERIKNKRELIADYYGNKT